MNSIIDTELIEQARTHLEKAQYIPCFKAIDDFFSKIEFDRESPINELRKLLSVVKTKYYRTVKDIDRLCRADYDLILDKITKTLYSFFDLILDEVEQINKGNQFKQQYAGTIELVLKLDENFDKFTEEKARKVIEILNKVLNTL